MGIGLLFNLSLNNNSYAQEPTNNSADNTRSWFRNQDQNAMRLLPSSPAQAQQEFTNPQWKAHAAYRAGDYASAAELLSEFDSADAHYNRANALAQQGNIKEAIKAYQQALDKDPTLQDAKDNKRLLENLPKQESQDSSENSEDSDDSDQSDENQSDKENQDDSNKDSDEESQDSEESKESENSSQEKQNKQDQASKNNADQNSSSEQDNNPPENDESSAEQQDDAQEAAAKDSEEGENPGAPQEDPTAQSDANESGDEQQTKAIEASTGTPLDNSAETRWLQKIPNDPGALLRRKLKMEAQRRQTLDEDKPW